MYTTSQPCFEMMTHRERLAYKPTPCLNREVCDQKLTGLKINIELLVNFFH